MSHVGLMPSASAPKVEDKPPQVSLLLVLYSKRLKGGLYRGLYREYYRLIKGDTRSLDNGSHSF